MRSLIGLASTKPICSVGNTMPLSTGLQLSSSS